MTTSPTEAPRSVRWVRDGAMAVVCALAGVLIAAWPHFAVDWRWVGDQDELYYIAIAERSYRGEPGDPALESGGRAPYRTAPLWPGIAAARGIDSGLGPWGVGLAWRIWGGATIGLFWFAVSRFRPRSESAPEPPSTILGGAAAIFMLAELGALEFRPLAQLAIVSVQVAAGGEGAASLFQSKPVLHPQWRIATPCLTLAFLLAHVWLTAMARDRGGRRWVIASGLALGSLFYVYFYYWTAAVCALAITTLLDRRRWRIYAATLAIGSAIGAPAILGDYGLKQTTSSDWLARTDKFLTIPRGSEVHFPKPALAMAALGFVAVWRWRRDLSYPWALGTTGLLLMNHQIMTRLQIENFHWKYVAGPMLEWLWIMLALGAIGKMAGQRRDIAQALVVSVAILGFVAGLWLRHAEASKTREAREIVQTIDERSSSLSANAQARDLVAGDEIKVDVACIAEGARPLSNYWTMLSPSIDDEEWERRIALNAVLQGTPRSRFLRDQEQALAADGRGFAGPWSRDPEDRERRLKRRSQYYEEFAADPTAAWERYPVRWLLLPADSASIPSPAWWRLRESDSRRKVWERVIPARGAGSFE